MKEEKPRSHGGARTGAGRPAAPKSNAVKATREALGTTNRPLSQDAMARRIGCTLAALRKMEAEKRLPSDPEVLAEFTALAQSAGVSLETTETEE